MADPITESIKAGGALVGGFFGARRKGQAIKKAGTTLANTYNQASQDIGKLPGMVNPAIDTAYSRAGEDVYKQAWDNMSNEATSVDLARTGMNTAVGGANTRLDESLTGVKGYLDPYATGGQTAFQNLSDLANAKPPTLEELQMDPGYAFRESEGQKALQRSAAARGVMQTGGFAKALTNYGQQAASQEYANAFDRYMKGREQSRLSLTSLAGIGSQAANQAAGYGVDIGKQYGSNLMTGAEYGGNVGLRGTEKAGDWLQNAAVYKGNAGIDSALKQTGNIWNANILGNQLGVQAGEATAASQYGLGDIWSKFYSGAGQSLGNLASSAYDAYNRGGGPGNGDYGGEVTRRR